MSHRTYTVYGTLENDQADVDANARLIAAAPDLLDAARFAVEICVLLERMADNDSMDSALRGALDRMAEYLRAAIAKATQS